MLKSIKKIGLFILARVFNFLEVIVFLLIVSAFLIRSVWFQTFLAHTAANYLSSQLHTKVQIDRVLVNGLEYAELEGIYIEDLHGDTLIFAPHLDVSLVGYSIENQFAVLEKINLNQARIKLQKYQGEEKLNLQFLIDYFSSDKEKEKSKFILKVNEISLKESFFTLDDWNKPRKDYGIDYSHLRMVSFGGEFHHIRTKGDVITMEIQELQLKEQSGFEIQDLDCHLLVNATKIKMGKLHIKTFGSEINTSGISLKYKDFGDFSDFVNSVYLFGTFQDSKLDTKDLSYFVPSIKQISHVFSISGEINGPLNDVQLSDLYIAASPETYFSGNLEFRGLPDIENTLMGIDINVLQTSKEDIDKINFKDFGLKEPLVLPHQVGNLGTIFLMGTMDGFYNDFDLRMDIVTDAGVAAGDFICSLDTNNQIHYDGKLSTAGMDVSLITGSSMLGNLTSDLAIKGKGLSPNDLDLIINGNMNHLDFKGYTYEEVTVNGHYVKKSFNGDVTIADKNIDLFFEGELNLNRKPYAFSFDAEVQKANFYDLHWISERESATACFNIDADGTASNLDDFSGYIRLENLAYFENGKDYSFEEIEFYSKGNTNYHTIDVSSEFANISMEGEFSLDTLDKSLYYLGAKILPSIFPQHEEIEFSHEDFDLKIEINDLTKLTELFYPDLHVSNETALQCDYNSDHDAFELYFKSDWIEYNNMRFANVLLDTTQQFGGGDALFYTFNLQIDTVYFSSRQYLENINLVAEAFQDNIGTSLYWAAEDSSYWANLYGDGYVLSKSKFEFDIHDSKIFSKMGLWNLTRDANIHIDSSSIHLENLLVSNDIQSIKLDGFISENPEDKLNFEIIDFSFENLNAWLGGSVELDGLLDLDGYVSNVYKDWYFDAYTFVEYLTINGNYAGNFEAGSNWNSEFKRMEMTGGLTRPDGKTDFTIDTGYYYIDRPGSNYYFNFNFDSTNLSIANAFMPEGMYVDGLADGIVYMRGPSDAPEFSGDLHLDNTDFTMDMLNVTYTINGLVAIEPDMIYAPNGIDVMDKYNAHSLLVGQFFHQNFKQFNYDFFATFDKPFMVLNTTYAMNPLYYGDAFVSGDISVNFEQILDININAKSEKGTNITLPLYGSEDVVLQDFVTFVNTGSVDKEYEVDLEGINLNLSMDITEDANFQLVFDEVVGDVMKGTGTGHIDMYIDQFYDFYMFGNYNISQGSYLFTLKDFINKKFQVKPGSEISWYGDPYEAEIDIIAYYPLKASLYDIMPESDIESGGYKQKTDVECIMHLTQSLFNPNIGFDILLPRSDENAKTVLRNLVNTEPEMNKQVFSLLILNKFLPRNDATAGSGSSSSKGVGFVESTTSEVLSNQLSNMISNFSDDFDIGFNYRPGDQISNDEVAVAMSTQLFNDRMTVKTNLGVSHGSATSGGNSNLIGDVDVEYKLNPPEGNLRVHAFNKSNEYDPTKASQSLNTQGVGAFYQESFDSFGELTCKISNLFRKKKDPQKNNPGKKDCVPCSNALSKEEKKNCKKTKEAARKPEDPEIIKDKE